MLVCLYLADKEVAMQLYPAICWCAEYCQRQRSKEGVICSNTDELEGRFATDGYANLSTSCLAYGGYLLAETLKQLGLPCVLEVRESNTPAII